MRFAEFARAAPAAVDVGRVEALWRAARDTYDPAAWVLPLPVWRLRPWDATGAAAWALLRDELAAAAVTTPMCLYVHVPFCASKCGFCDSYSFALRRHAPLRIAALVDRLEAELVAWATVGTLAARPLTTVHLGGGTPSFLGVAALTRLVAAVGRHLAVTPDTEWALESTARELTPSLLSALHDLGFRRLHVGVQSLQDHVRAAIGRTAGADDVVAVLAAARSRGWVVSVDMICGLPGQDLPGLVDDLERLLDAGVDGVSLYELLVYPQNRRWAESHGVAGSDRHLPNYWTFLAGADLLERRGFRPNVFNHWAGPRDRNVYFTSPSRGEDLLAVGPVADGVFGDLHYRHPAFAGYATGELPPLQGVLRHAAGPGHARIATGILGAGLDVGQVRALTGLCGGAALLERWRSSQLVGPDPVGGLRLTPSGAWFAGSMMAELGRLPAVA